MSVGSREGSWFYNLLFVHARFQLTSQDKWKDLVELVMLLLTKPLAAKCPAFRIRRSSLALSASPQGAAAL